MEQSLVWWSSCFYFCSLSFERSFASVRCLFGFLWWFGAVHWALHSRSERTSCGESVHRGRERGFAMAQRGSFQWSSNRSRQVNGQARSRTVGGCFVAQCLSFPTCKWRIILCLYKFLCELCLRTETGWLKFSLSKLILLLFCWWTLNSEEQGPEAAWEASTLRRVFGAVWSHTSTHEGTMSGVLWLFYLTTPQMLMGM